MPVILTSARSFAESYGIDINEASPGPDGVVGKREVLKLMHKMPLVLVEQEAIRYFSNPRVLFDKQPLRSYQTQALKSCIFDGQIHSGIIVMPCGSGKTLLGSKICECLGEKCVIVTTRQPSQWVKTLVNCTCFTEKEVSVIGSLNELTLINVTTYSMLCNKIFTPSMAQLRRTQIGLLILDEVHTSAAQQYMKHIQSSIAFKSCVGLTATPVREDDEYHKVVQFIGPTLCTIDKKSLEDQSYLAKVACFAYTVPIDDKLVAIGPTACDVNPCKFDATEVVLRHLWKAKRKTLLFCDDINTLLLMHKFLNGNGVPTLDPVHMKTFQSDREATFDTFNECKEACILPISRVGDDAIDLPDASAVVITWNRWKSRRQIMQRIGRVSRPGRNALVIVILSDYSKELEVHAYRENYLKEQNYVFVTQPFTSTIFASMFKQRESCLCKRTQAVIDFFSK